MAAGEDGQALLEAGGPPLARGRVPEAVALLVEEAHEEGRGLPVGGVAVVCVFVFGVFLGGGGGDLGGMKVSVGCVWGLCVLVERREGVCLIGG